MTIKVIRSLIRVPQIEIQEAIQQAIEFMDSEVARTGNDELELQFKFHGENIIFNRYMRHEEILAFYLRNASYS